MRKCKILFSLICAILFTCLIACGNTNNNSSSVPNFYEDTRFMPIRLDNAKVTDINYQEFEAKTARKESFVLFIKQEGCAGCERFKPILDKYVNETKVVVYAIERKDIPTDGKIYFTYTPTLQVFQGGQLLDSIDPEVIEETNYKKAFEKLSDLKVYLNKYIVITNQLYIDDVKLDLMIENKETFVVYFGWKSCGDCSALNKMFLDEYLYDTKDLNQMLYALEVDPWRSQKTDHPEVWEAFTSKYHLSKASDEVFGYRTGVVPTIQYYVDGKLNDVVVYFNDVLISVLDDKGEITGYQIDFENETGVFSYYPEEVKVLFDTVVFEDYQDYKEKTNEFYQNKLIELFNKAYK